MLDAATLRRLWPRAPQALVDAMAAHAPAAFAKYGLTTRLRVLHLLAQISHESGGGTITAENLNYSTAARIAAVWPRRFTPASAAPYVHNPKGLADKVYNGRMGNRPGTDDGYNYRGRGLLQITGRDSYQQIGALVGLQLEAQPDLAGSPTYALDIAAAEFKKLGCLTFCDRDNVEAVTRRVNGGYTGLASRKAWLARWKAALPAEAPIVEAAAMEPASLPAPEEDEPPQVEIPRGSDEVLPPGVDHPDKTMGRSKTGGAAIGIMTGGAAATAQSVNDAIGPILQAKDSLNNLGLLDAVHAASGSPLFWVGLAVLALAGFVWWDRRNRLQADHV